MDKNRASPKLLSADLKKTKTSADTGVDMYKH